MKKPRVSLILVGIVMSLYSVSSYAKCTIVMESPGTLFDEELFSAGYSVVSPGNLGDIGLKRILTGERVIGQDPFGNDVIERSRKFVLYRDGKAVAETKEHPIRDQTPLLRELKILLLAVGCDPYKH